MKIVIFGLTITTSWGNGHGTLWRGLCRALHARGHRVVFYERDLPYYRPHRDLHEADWCRIVLYPAWEDVRDIASRDLDDADVALVTSYCPDGRPASAFVCESRAARKVFYDLDSPVTLERLRQRESVPYLPESGLGAFDLVLSYAGGTAIDGLQRHLGARVVMPLYGSVDPDVHHPVAPMVERASDLSYIGTYAKDRQDVLERLFVAPASLRPARKFALAGSQYPEDFPWGANIFYFSHLAPGEHASFYSSSGMTLNITRGPMAASGYCPSGRLFEATACGATVLSDWWEGLDTFFEPARELLIARQTQDVLDALELSDAERKRIGRRARERTLTFHTAARRAEEFERLLEVA